MKQKNKKIIDNYEKKNKKRESVKYYVNQHHNIGINLKTRNKGIKWICICIYIYLYNYVHTPCIYICRTLVLLGKLFQRQK